MNISRRQLLGAGAAAITAGLLAPSLRLIDLAQASRPRTR